MKRSKLAWMLALAASGGIASSPRARGQTAGAADQGAVDHEMKAMDTNGDGKVSAEEHAAGASRMFETMDANKDGKVTAVEMEGAHQRVTGKKATKGEMPAADKIKAVDTNGDGVLTAEEHRAGSKSMFERMDTDHDGFLTREELAAGHAKLMPKTPR
jgi:Ca2+-binding EF-hand superfamily protein